MALLPEHKILNVQLPDWFLPSFFSGGGNDLDVTRNLPADESTQLLLEYIKRWNIFKIRRAQHDLLQDFVFVQQHCRPGQVCLAILPAILVAVQKFRFDTQRLDEGQPLLLHRHAIVDDAAELAGVGIGRYALVQVMHNAVYQATVAVVHKHQFCHETPPGSAAPPSWSAEIQSAAPARHWNASNPLSRRKRTASTENEQNGPRQIGRASCRER